MMRGITKLRKPEAFYGWMYKIVVHVCYDFNQRKHDAPCIQMDSANIGDCVIDTDESVQPSEAYDQQSDKAAVLDMIKGLPKAQMQSLYLRYFADLSYKEISEVLNVSTNTVGTNIEKGKKGLAKIMDRDGKFEFALAPVLAAALNYDHVQTTGSAAYNTIKAICDGIVGTLASAGAVSATTAAVQGGATAASAVRVVVAACALTAAIGGGSAIYGVVQQQGVTVPAMAQSVSSSTGPVTTPSSTTNYTFTPNAMINFTKTAAANTTAPSSGAAGSGAANATTANAAAAGSDTSSRNASGAGVADAASVNADVPNVDPTQAAISISNGTPVSWQIAGSDGTVFASGTGASANSGFNTLQKGDYYIQWDVQDANGTHALVRRAFSVV
jgi:RNA polymerase sigma factor (sigma-70 family)